MSTPTATGALVLTSFDTGSFSFTVLTGSREAGVKALKAAWSRHCKTTGADRRYLTEYAEDITHTDMTVGVVLRDGSTI